MTNKIQEIIKSLRMCGSSDQCTCEDCAFYIEGSFCQSELIAADTIEQLSNSLETALSTIKNLLRNSAEACNYCKHYQKCEMEECPCYIYGDQVQNENGDTIDMKWSCVDFDYGTCPLLENTPCGSCDFDCNWEWNGRYDMKEELC